MRSFLTIFVDVRVDGVPSVEEGVRSDEGREFQGDFSDLCSKRGITQAFTPADSPHFNGSVELALGLIETARNDARILAKEIHPGIESMLDDSSWAKSNRWACESHNCAATTANPGDKSPHEMWHGEVAPLKILPVLKPGYCRAKRTSKSQNIAQTYLGPSSSYPRDAVRVLTKGRYAITARDLLAPYAPRVFAARASSF